MGLAADLKAVVDTVLRDYVVPSLPGSGLYNPPKADHRTLLKGIIDLGDVAGTTKVVALVADLAGLPSPAHGNRAEVRADPLGDVTNGNGVWSYKGAPTNAWVWISPLMDGESLDAIQAIEDAAVAALASIPPSLLAPVTVATPNANLWNLTAVAPYTVDADKVVCGLAGSSNTGAMRINIPGVGEKDFVLPNRQPIPRRHFIPNDFWAAKYVAAIDKVVLLWGAQPLSPLLSTVPAAGDVAQHIKVKIAHGGQRVGFSADATLLASQTIEVIAAFDKPFGNVQFTLYDSDGTTSLGNGVIRDIDKVTAVSPANVWRAGNRLLFRLNDGVPYLIQGPDRQTVNTAKLFSAVLDPPQLPSIGRPVAVRRVDATTWFIDIYPHNNRYSGGRKRRIGSDFLRFVMIDQGAFQGDIYAPALNSYFAHYGGKMHPVCNLMFDDLVGGFTTENDQVPSTIEMPFYCVKVGDTAANAVVAGLGHSNITPDSWTLIGTVNDGTTGTILAATRSSPLTVRLNGNSLYQVGQTIRPVGVTGMTELNDQNLTITAVTTTVLPNDTLTIGAVNSTGYGVFTGNPGGIEVDTGNLKDLPIGPVFYGDRIKSTLTGMNNTRTPGENHSRFTYAVTYGSFPDYDVIIDTKHDTTDPAVNITPGTVNGNMGYLFLVCDADQAQGLLDGAVVPVTVGGLPSNVMPVGQMDGGQRIMGPINEMLMAHSDDPNVVCRVRNISGAGFSHRENGVGVARSNPSFISTFPWGNKGYGDPIRTAGGVQNIAGIVFQFQQTITIMNRAPLT